MNQYRVYVYMDKSQTIREFILEIEAPTPMIAQQIAVTVLNGSLTYKPVEGLIDSISVHKK
jgi:hypothetical protein